MTFTRHGHHIPGTSIEDEERRVVTKVDCEGCGRCIKCTEDEIKAFRFQPKFR